MSRAEGRQFRRLPASIEAELAFQFDFYDDAYLDADRVSILGTDIYTDIRREGDSVTVHERVSETVESETVDSQHRVYRK